jgi:SAM-dependent methyltransferase
MDIRHSINHVLALVLAQNNLPRKAVRMLLPLSFRSSFGPTGSHEWVRAQQARATRWLEPVDFGNLRRLKPISAGFGYRRGKLPIDRYYIERFLAAHSSDIRGRVLEIEDNRYTCKFGGDLVVRSDVLHVTEGNPNATIVDDLASGRKIPSDAFDCIILTHTLQCIYDLRAAVTTLHRILRPGGVLLAAIPGIGKISRWDMQRWGDYWRFTTLSARCLFETVFPAANVEICAYGNVLAAIANLHGLAAEELSEHELNHHDPDFELTIAIRAVKPSSVEMTQEKA